MVYTLSSVVSSAETLNEVIEARQENTIAIDKIIDTAFIFIIIPPFFVKFILLSIILYSIYKKEAIFKINNIYYTILYNTDKWIFRLVSFNKNRLFFSQK